MQRAKPLIAAGITAVVLGLPVLWVGNKLHQDSVAEVHDRVDLIASQTALRLQDYLKSRLLSLHLMRQGMESGLIKTKEQFLDQATVLCGQLSGIQALNWIDKDFNIIWVSPLDGNEPALGKNILENPIAAVAIQGSASMSKTCVTAPLQLFQGGLGFATYFPVYSHDQGEPQIQGFINGVFRSQGMLEDALGLDLRSRFGIEIWDHDAQLYASNPGGEEHLCLSRSGAASLAILDRTWDIQLFPTESTFAALGDFHNVAFIFGGLGFVFAFAACIFLFLARREEHQQTLEQKRLVKERMAQARKMEAVGELAGGVAHDFNNLLTAITGSASLAAMDVLPTSATGRHLKRILQACDRASEMTSRLLTFSRTQHMDRGHCDAKSELDALYGLLRPLVRGDIQFTFQVEGELESLPLAPSELGQVVLNLVTNSMDALPQGGELAVRVEPKTHDAQSRPGNWLHLCVSDNGVGMTPEVRDRVFEPFFTTKKAGEGTGLGLATVYGIVRGAKGSIQVESEPQLGTQIHVFLPMESDSPTAYPEKVKGVVKTRECNILVVEDEEAVRAVSIAILESVGHEVVAVCNGKEALKFFEQQGKVDLVFTDTFMPEVGGLDLARKLREDGYAGSIIITTGYATDLSMDVVRELKASFLAKPFSRTELLSLVEYCLAKGDSA
ncbi:MAG: ATP-binding protein [Planctomycetota bacterium]